MENPIDLLASNLGLAKEHIFLLLGVLVGFFFGRRSKSATQKISLMQEISKAKVITSVGGTSLSAAQISEITQLLTSGKKIEAIKQYRQYTGLGLKEAKDAVEAME